MIIAFAKDWDDVPTSISHVLKEMGKTRPVLWVNSIGTRKPGVARPRDVARLLRRIRSGWGPAETMENQLSVLAPMLIPKAESRIGQWINRKIFQGLIDRELRRRGSPCPEYWCSVPNAVDLLPEEGRVSGVPPSLPEPQAPELRRACRCQVSGKSDQDRESRIENSASSSPASAFRIPHSAFPLVVYLCVDDWSRFEGLDGEWLAKKETALLRRADVVFTASRYLEKKCRAVAGERVRYLAHGVEHAKFARALDSDLPLPDDIAGLRRPIVGFYGTLARWIDFDLTEQLARTLKDWSFVFIGPEHCEAPGLRQLPNVKFLGRREHATLPAYCRGFAAGIIPYDMRNPRMESVNPVKTKELLAAGVPLVASALPELQGYGEDVLTCGSLDEWVSALERQARRTDRAAISARMRGEDWSLKVAEMRRVVDAAWREQGAVPGADRR
jgi:glycosyltransferase involved in cell wall biosynthesis